MPIEHFVWTTHATGRCRRRLLDPIDVERTVRAGHAAPRINLGKADWIAQGTCTDGRRLAVVYDHPHRGDSRTARIISVWDL